MDSLSNHDSNNNDSIINTNPRLAIVLSGKRKSGKDYIANRIIDYLGAKNKSHLLAVLRIAAPIKKVFSEKHNLVLERLLDSTFYKEDYRQKMVEWSQNYRQSYDMNCFLKMSIKDERAEMKPIWLLTDARRICDVEFFENLLQQDPTMKLLKIRIVCDTGTRSGRGWTYVRDIDDQETECGLDHYEKWTHVIENNFDNQNDIIMRELEHIMKEISFYL